MYGFIANYLLVLSQHRELGQKCVCLCVCADVHVSLPQSHPSSCGDRIWGRFGYVCVHVLGTLGTGGCRTQWWPGSSLWAALRSEPFGPNSRPRTTARTSAKREINETPVELNYREDKIVIKGVNLTLKALSLSGSRPSASLILSLSSWSSWSSSSSSMTWERLGVMSSPHVLSSVFTES